MEIKFKAGDRVEAVSSPRKEIPVGTKGTVIKDGVDLVGCVHVIWDDVILENHHKVNQWNVVAHRLKIIDNPIKWVRPKADNNIVNNAARVLAKVYTHVSNVSVKIFKFLRGVK